MPILEIVSKPIHWLYICRPKPAPATQSEEKELRRVFLKLCDYQSRLRLEDSIAQMEMGMKLVYSQSQGRETEATKQLQAKVTEHKGQLAELNAKPESDRKISCNDVYEMLKTLKQKTDKKKVEDMIWEVDEDLDGHLCWNEFRLMYNRNLQDQTGLEPNKMYHLVQFMIYDKNNNNRVSKDGTMNMLYARYGTKMNEKLVEIFGSDMKDSGREGGEIGFHEFESALSSVSLQTFWKTAKGKNVAQTERGRRAMELSFPMPVEDTSTSLSGSFR